MQPTDEATPLPPADTALPAQGQLVRQRPTAREVIVRAAVIAASTVIALAVVTVLTSVVLAIAQPHSNVLRGALTTFSQWAPPLTIVMTVVVYPFLLGAERLGRRPRVRTLAIILSAFLALVAVAALIALLTLSGEVRPFTDRSPVESSPGSGAPELGWDAGLAFVIVFLFIVYAVPPIAALVGALTMSATVGARWPRTTIVAGVVVIALAIGGNAAAAVSPDQPNTAGSITGSVAGEELRNAIGSPVGVASVNVDSASSAASDTARTAKVLMTQEASASEIHAAADDAIDAAGRVGWAGAVTIARIAAPDPDQDPDTDAPRPQKPWSVQLVAAAGRDDPEPGSASGAGDDTASRRAVAHRLLDDVMVVDSFGPGVSVVVGAGWPSVQVTDVSKFMNVFTRLNGLSTFADGATYSVPGDSKPLRIVHVPSRITISAVEAIVNIAVEHPRAEVLLQASTSGPQWPVLYIAHLSTAEAAAVEAQLLSPTLATADPDGYAIDFVLTAGSTTLTGTLGNVQE